jgi:O-antigen/teichoic acid export membrane protein
VSEIPVEEALERERPAAATPRLGIAALASDAAIYGGTRVLLKGLAFLLVPLYAHFLTPAQFGVLELILATSAFIDVFINLPGALARFYFEDEDRTWRRQVISTYFAIEAAYPAVLIGVLVALSGPLSLKITGAERYAGLFVIALVDLYLTNIVDLPMNLCRLRRKPVTFAVYSFTRGLTQIIFTILLLMVFHLDLKGIVVASLVSVCVAFVVTVREYGRDLTLRIPRRLVGDMLSFSWPTVFGGLAFYALNLADRLVVRGYHGLHDAGLYGTAFRYSQIVTVGVFAFRMGWPQWHYSWLRTGRHQQMVARGAIYYFLGCGFLVVLVSAWILPLFHLIMARSYWPATQAVAPLALAGLATGAYTIFAVGFNVTRRMRALVPLTTLGGAIAVGLYFLLIPPFSYVGAAWATVASLAALALLVVVASNRIYPVAWPWARIGLATGAAVAFALGSLAVDAWVPLGLSLPIRLGFTAGYPVLLAVLGFFPPGDLRKLRARLRSAARRLVS